MAFIVEDDIAFSVGFYAFSGLFRVFRALLFFGRYSG